MEFGFDLENPLLFPSSSSNENFPLLFHREIEHMPPPTYLQSLLLSPHSPLSIRRLHTLSFILHFSGATSHYAASSYLAINYMDRFFSAHPIADEGKPWIAKLVAVSCVSLALKMNDVEFSVSDFQDEVVDSVRVERMELLILGALKWRMRSINPFSFLNFFLALFLDLKDQSSIQHQIKAMAMSIISEAQYDIKLLEFKPSVVAASALLCAAHRLIPSLFLCLRKAISNFEYINKENLFKCCNMMVQNSSPMDGQDSFSQTSSRLCTPPDLLNVECCSSFISGTKRKRETNVCRIQENRIPKCIKFEDFTTNK